MSERLHEGVDLCLRRLERGAPRRIVALGPEGTVSEAAAQSLATNLACRGYEHVRVELHPTHEQCAQQVHSGRAALLVVANDGAETSELYLDARLRLAAAFVKDTPAYGLAAAVDELAAEPARVAAHPTLVPLIGQLLPQGLRVAEIRGFPSSQAAAAATAAGAADLALTTRTAAREHGLSFLSPARSIKMLWSVFGDAAALGGAPRPAGRALVAAA